MLLAVDVATALLQHCEKLKFGNPQMKRAMPDADFTPEAGKPYYRIDLFRNAPFWTGLSAGKIDQGLMQVTVVWPKGQGIIKSSRAADAVLAHFPKNLKLTLGTARVKIGQGWVAAPLLDEAWTETPVTIPWTALAL